MLNASRQHITKAAFACLLLVILVPYVAYAEGGVSVDYLTDTSDLMKPINWFRGFIDKALVNPVVQPIAVFTAKALIVLFVAGEMLAYLGVIGEPGEGLYEWAKDNELGVKHFLYRWGTRPGNFIRMRVKRIIHRFNNLPPKAKFASAVGTGTTAFPLLFKATLWSGVVAAVVWVLAEFLAVLGVLGEPGEGLREWFENEEAEPVKETLRRVIREIRMILRNKLKISKVLAAGFNNLKTDQVFWIGFSVGAVASMVLPYYYE